MPPRVRISACGGLRIAALEAKNASNFDPPQAEILKARRAAL